MSDRATVLLVEDDPDIAETFSIFLRSAGDPEIDVVQCGALAGALNRIAAGGIDLVLLDLNLPDSRGLETFQRVQQANPRTAVVVMTAADDQEQAIQAVRDGAEDYLFKGRLTRRQILRALRYSIERSRRRLAEAQLAVRDREMKIAQQIQQQLYPTTVPIVDGYEISGWSVPAEPVGGDYFDFFRLCDGTWAIAIGDASGHGVGPALLMAETRACLRTLATQTSSVQTILAQAGELLSDGMLESHFVTLMLTRLDGPHRTLDYVGAGHPPGMIFDGRGRVRAVLESSTVPMGIPCLSRTPVQQSVKLHRDDTIVLTTDGVFEAGISARDPFGTVGLKRIVRRHLYGNADALVRSVVQAVRSHCFPAALDDDLTAVVIRVCAGRRGRGTLSAQGRQKRSVLTPAKLPLSARVRHDGS